MKNVNKYSKPISILIGVLLILLLSSIVWADYGGGGRDYVASNPTASPAILVNDATIAIKNFAFKPASLTVKAGSTITWINQDSVVHNVVVDNVTSPDLAKGDKWSKTFAKPGKYNYSCAFHAGMTGIIIVK